MARPDRARKQPRAPRNLRGLLPLTGDRDDAGQHAENDDGADQRREIGIDLRDADLGENRRQGSEHGR